MKSFYSLLFLICSGYFAYGEDSIPKKFKPAAIPIINYNRTQGICVGAMAAGYYKFNSDDTISPSSNTGVFGMYTSEGSYMIFGFHQMYFNQDKWRIRAAGGHVDINFQFFYENPLASVGGFVDYKTKANFAFLQVQHRIFNRIYAGPTIAYVHSETTFEVPEESGGDMTTISNMSNIGYIISNDTRDHVQYPSTGSFLNFRNQFYRDWTGSDYRFTKYMINYNRFFNLSSDSSKILAARVNCTIADGDVPFEGQTVVGQDDIRGYSQGEFRNDQVYTLQGEYRWNFYRKFGMVGFFGVASAVEKAGDIFSSKILPGGGIGLRYRMIPSEKINVGVDFGVGVNDYSITFRIGESFGR
jgi:outer membrane protein assembly factor BamA